MGFYRRSRPIRRSAEEIAAEKAAKLAKSMTCQCCARDIFAETGVIAHHGYERPAEGWQTASCFGARRLPFEVTRDDLGTYIDMIIGRIADVTEHRRKVIAEETTVPFGYRDKTAQKTRFNPHGDTTVHVTRQDFPEAFAKYLEVRPYRQSPEPTFDALKDSKVKRLSGEISALNDTLVFQKKRFKDWVQTHRQGEEGEETWMPIDSTPVVTGIDLPEDDDGWQV
jgi:hypothetical protein